MKKYLAILLVGVFALQTVSVFAEEPKGNKMSFGKQEEVDLNNEFSIILEDASVTDTSNVISGVIENKSTTAYENVILSCLFTDEDEKEITTTEAVVDDGGIIYPDEKKDFVVEIDRNDDIASVEVTCKSAEKADEESKSGKLTVTDKEWLVQRNYTFCVSYEKEITINPKNELYLVMTNIGDGIAKNGEYVLYNSIYDDPDEFNHENIYNPTIYGVYKIDTSEEAKSSIVANIISVEPYSELVPDLFDIKLNVNSSTYKNCLIAFDIKKEDEIVSTGTLECYQGKYESLISASSEGLTKENIKLDILGIIPFEETFNKSDFSLGEYSYEIVDSYSYSSCYGTQEVLCTKEVDGLLMVKISEKGEEDRYQTINIVGGKGEIETYNSEIDISNESLYSFEILDFLPLENPLFIEYPITGNEEKTQLSFSEVADYVSGKVGYTVGSDKSWFSFDSNTNDIEDYDDSYWLKDLPKILEMLGFSDVLMAKIERTSYDDGIQEDHVGNIYVSWTYHPDYGLEMLFEEK